jgi:hypothetical protein
MATYSITCNCGHEEKDGDRRMVEAKMWHHAIHEHPDMIQGMSSDEFAGVLKDWDSKFKEQDKSA